MHGQNHIKKYSSFIKIYDNSVSQTLTVVTPNRSKPGVHKIRLMVIVTHVTSFLRLFGCCTFSILWF